jgi:hypothetical protein
VVTRVVPPTLVLVLVGLATGLLLPVLSGSRSHLNTGAAVAAPHVKAPLASQGLPAGRYKGLLPTSSNFIPIAVWDQAPNGGNVPSKYANQAQAFAAMGVNIFVGLNAWPERFGSDDGELAAAVAAKMYVIGGGDPSGNGANYPQSVASIAKLLEKTPGASKYFVGYQWGDEPVCTTDVASQVAKIEREDPKRMDFDNEGAWVAWLPRNLVGDAACLTESKANLRATSVASADEYALTDPWHTYLCPRAGGKGYDCLWVYGEDAQNLRKVAGPGTPVWEFVETGTNDLGLSSENNGDSEVAMASPVQVNSAAWLSLLEGANGIEWFCDQLQPDGTPIWDYCASNATIRNNLTFIDHTVESFAPEINAPNVPDTLTLQSSNSAVPIVADVKDVAGVRYLMVEADRLGATTATYTLRGDDSGTATLVYDSNKTYAPSVSEQGKTFALNAHGVFKDSLPASYSVKIYKIVAHKS